MAESGSNGIHDGTVVYEIGDPNLKPEQSLEFDLTPGIRTKDINAEVSLFYNSINNFIYAQQLSSALGGDSLNNSTTGFPDAPVFRYTQTNAVMMGGEASIDIHPSGLRWFDLYAGYSYVDARLKNVPDSVNILPFIPPARLRAEITLTAPKICNALRNSYFRFGVNYSFEQDRVYQISSIYYGLNHIETVPAYTLLNAGIGTNVMSRGRKVCSIYANVDNIANISYIDYMSRFKYMVNPAPNGGTSNYVYNMGRNVSIKVLFPLDFGTHNGHAREQKHAAAEEKETREDD